MTPRAFFYMLELNVSECNEINTIIFLLLIHSIPVLEMLKSKEEASILNFILVNSSYIVFF